MIKPKLEKALPCAKRNEYFLSPTYLAERRG